MTVLVVDKPIGPTSFAVVRQVRGALARHRGVRGVKVGHGGTLDPAASGVLPVCVGEATKLAAFLLEADKEYEATVRFGVETDTLDADEDIDVGCSATVSVAEGLIGAGVAVSATGTGVSVCIGGWLAFAPGVMSASGFVPASAVPSGVTSPG